MKSTSSLKNLGLYTNMNMLLPHRLLADALGKRKPRYRSLSLLHGYSADYSAWQRWTSIER